MNSQSTSIRLTLVSQKFSFHCVTIPAFERSAIDTHEVKAAFIVVNSVVLFFPSSFFFPVTSFDGAWVDCPENRRIF